MENGITITGGFYDFLRHNKGLMESTIQEYQKDLASYEYYRQRRALGRGLLETTKAEVEDYVNDMSRRGLSAATIKRKVSALREFFRYTRDKGLTTENPALYVQTPKSRQELYKAADERVVRAYLETEATSDGAKFLHAITALIATTGLRISEALNLDTQDIDKATMSIKVTGKGGKERTVYYNESTREHLNAWARGKRGRIFESFTPEITRQMMSTQLRMGARGITPHQLRHLFATLMLKDGATIEEVSTILGHSSTRTTERYIHLPNAHMMETYKRHAPRF